MRFEGSVFSLLIWVITRKASVRSFHLHAGEESHSGAAETRRNDPAPASGAGKPGAAGRGSRTGAAGSGYGAGGRRPPGSLPPSLGFLQGPRRSRKPRLQRGYTSPFSPVPARAGDEVGNETPAKGRFIVP